MMRKTDIGKTVIGKTDIGKTDIGKSHTNKEHNNKENKNKEKRDKSNARFQNWYKKYAYRVNSANCYLAVAKPSPLGRVDERSEGQERFVAIRNYLFRQPFGLPPSPKGKALRCTAKLQFLMFYPGRGEYAIVAR